MDFYRKILIFIIICITFYLLYRLIISRIKYKYTYSNSKSLESFASLNNYYNETVKSISTNNKNLVTVSSFRIQNMTRKNGILTDAPMKLKQFCIKSSYCSAFTGKECSVDMILYVLSRGCRFLDLEIYYVNGELVVSYSNNYLTPSVNTIPLGNVLSIINDNAFGSVSPNKKDPLFLQFRVKYLPSEEHKNVLNTTLSMIYDSLASSIQLNIQNRFMNTLEKDVSELLFSDIMGTTLIVMDTSQYNYSFANLSSKLAKVVHIRTNSKSLSKSTFSDIEKMKKYTLTTQDDGVTTDATILQEITPTTLDEGFEYTMPDNYDGVSMLLDYGFNITPMQFWNNGSHLSRYEDIFNKGKSGILNISDAISYAYQLRAIPKIIFP